MTPTKMEPGTLVWSKIKGFPYWPSVICSPEDVPESVLKAKKKNAIVVRFVVDHNYGWIDQKEILPFRGAHFEKLSGHKRVNGDPIKEAIELESNPNLIKKFHSGPSSESVHEKESREKNTSEEKDNGGVERQSSKNKRKELEDETTEQLSATSAKPAKKRRKVKISQAESTASESQTNLEKTSVHKNPKSSIEKNQEDSKDIKRRKKEVIHEKTKVTHKSSVKPKKPDQDVSIVESKSSETSNEEHKHKKKTLATLEDIKKLQRYITEATQANMIVRALKMLGSYSIPLELLAETGLGKLLKRLCKHENPTVAKLAISRCERIEKQIRKAAKSGNFKSLTEAITNPLVSK